MGSKIIVSANGKGYTDNMLRIIGDEVASIWGGSCYDYEIDQEAGDVIFYCMEHGEKFASTISFNQLSEYE